MLKSPSDLVFQAKQATNEVSIDKAPAVIAQCDVLIDVREFEEFQETLKEMSKLDDNPENIRAVFFFDN